MARSGPPSRHHHAGGLVGRPAVCNSLRAVGGAGALRPREGHCRDRHRPILPAWDARSTDGEDESGDQRGHGIPCRQAQVAARGRPYRDRLPGPLSSGRGGPEVDWDRSQNRFERRYGKMRHLDCSRRTGPFRLSDDCLQWELRPPCESSGSATLHRCAMAYSTNAAGLPAQSRWSSRRIAPYRDPRQPGAVRRIGRCCRCRPTVRCT